MGRSITWYETPLFLPARSRGDSQEPGQNRGASPQSFGRGNSQQQWGNISQLYEIVDSDTQLFSGSYFVSCCIRRPVKCGCSRASCQARQACLMLMQVAWVATRASSFASRIAQLRTCGLSISSILQISRTRRFSDATGSLRSMVVSDAASLIDDSIPWQNRRRPMGSVDSPIDSTGPPRASRFPVRRPQPEDVQFGATRHKSDMGLLQFVPLRMSAAEMLPWLDDTEGFIGGPSAPRHPLVRADTSPSCMPKFPKRL